MVFFVEATAVLIQKYVVGQANIDILLGRLAKDVKVDEASVDRVFAGRHLVCIVHVVPLPVTELPIRACGTCLGVVLSNNHLRHLVYKEGLLAR